MITLISHFLMEILIFLPWIQKERKILRSNILSC